MAAQCDALSGYLQQQQSDHGSNSERSTDSPQPGSEEDLSGPQPPPDPEWTEERFRVDRKKLEIMLLGKDKERSTPCDRGGGGWWEGGVQVTVRGSGLSARLSGNTVPGREGVAVASLATAASLLFTSRQLGDTLCFCSHFLHTFLC